MERWHNAFRYFAKKARTGLLPGTIIKLTQLFSKMKGIVSTAIPPGLITAPYPWSIPREVIFQQRCAVNTKRLKRVFRKSGMKRDRIKQLLDTFHASGCDYFSLEVALMGPTARLVDALVLLEHQRLLREETGITYGELGGLACVMIGQRAPSSSATHAAEVKAAAANTHPDSVLLAASFVRLATSKTKDQAMAALDDLFEDGYRSWMVPVLLQGDAGCSDRKRVALRAQLANIAHCIGASVAATREAVKTLSLQPGVLAIDGDAAPADMVAHLQEVANIVEEN